MSAEGEVWIENAFKFAGMVLWPLGSYIFDRSFICCVAGCEMPGDQRTIPCYCGIFGRLFLLLDGTGSEDDRDVCIGRSCTFAASPYNTGRDRRWGRMVFCSDRIISHSNRKFTFAVVRNYFLRNIQSDPSGCFLCRWRSDREAKASVSSVSSSGGTVADLILERGSDTGRFSASLTVEAAFVMIIVLFAIGLVIQSAYTLHDEVTGKMILEAVIEEARYNITEEKKEGYFSERGTKMGNPRLWLGDYRVNIDMTGGKVSGKAAAGEWSAQIELSEFRPELFLRRLEAFREKKGGKADGRDGT